LAGTFTNLWKNCIKLTPKKHIFRVPKDTWLISLSPSVGIETNMDKFLVIKNMGPWKVCKSWPEWSMAEDLYNSWIFECQTIHTPGTRVTHFHKSVVWNVDNVERFGSVCHSNVSAFLMCQISRVGRRIFGHEWTIWQILPLWR
jgi:hypothetical protein